MQAAHWDTRGALNDDDIFAGYLGPPAYEESATELADDTAEGTIDRDVTVTDDLPSIPPGKVPWMLMTAIMTAEVLGIGVLTLPRTFVRLGWIPGHIVLFSLYVVTTYTGMLLYRLRNAWPDSRSYPTLFSHVYGKGGYVYASVIVYILLFMNTSAAVLVQAHSWEAAVRGAKLTLLQWTLVSAAVAWFVLQFRTMKNVGWLSLLGIVSILVPVALTFGKVLHLVRTDTANYPRGSTALFGSNMATGLVASMDIVYAYAGHVVFLELLGQIRTPQHFPRSLYISQTFVYLVYAAVGTTLYAVCGDAVWLMSPFTAVVKEGAIGGIIQAFVILHITITVTINGNVLIRAVQNAFEPGFRACCGRGSAVAAREDKSVAAILWWALWSAGTLFIAVLLISSVSNFEIFIGLTAAIAASQATLSWPGVLDLKVFYKNRRGVRGAIRNFSSAFAALIGIISFGFGLMANILEWTRALPENPASEASRLVHNTSSKKE